MGFGGFKVRGLSFGNLDLEGDFGGGFEELRLRIGVFGFWITGGFRSLGFECGAGVFAAVSQRTLNLLTPSWPVAVVSLNHQILLRHHHFYLLLHH